MIDREKVIKGLECCVKESEWYKEPCRECPYGATYGAKGGGCIDQLLADTIILLKEQEGVEPIFDCEEPILRIGQFHCGNCNHSFGISHYRYCPYCGRPVKWKGE